MKKQPYLSLSQNSKNAFLVGSAFFFLLFIFESFYLRQNASSFNGAHTEKIILIASILLGLLSMHRVFFIGLTMVIILSMIPLFIPFIMLLQFIFSTAKCYTLDSNTRLEVIDVFGQGVQDLALYQKQNAFFEQKIIQFGIDFCHATTIDQIDTAFFENNCLYISSKEVNTEHQLIIDLNKQTIRSYNDSLSTTFGLLPNSNRISITGTMSE